MSDYIGEPVNIKLHSEQAGALAKAFNPKDEEMILAALLHDLGHVIGMEAGESAEGMGGCGIPRHEHVGADFLKLCGFSDRICKLVRSHVSAKRYLVWKDPNYKLSDASRTTLEHQGGPMKADEAKKYEADPDFKIYLQLRKWDEAAKVEAKKISVPTIADYKPLFKKYCNDTQTLEKRLS